MGVSNIKEARLLREEAELNELLRRAVSLQQSLTQEGCGGFICVLSQLRDSLPYMCYL